MPTERPFPRQDAGPGAPSHPEKPLPRGRSRPFFRAQRPATDSSALSGVLSSALALAAWPVVTSTNFQASRSSGQAGDDALEVLPGAAAGHRNAGTP